ncbi:uncharacterized protein LOC125266044 [Megalobrama amblycephala]|uniref:uncharacterized protein LOC125266044 n=1 Tax=Megalobrama amblycephala TaxID=75352 RepID=UPI00201474DE|nr:uncharacterized protein LOC125266044 [Megalobrama amblycephala]
MGWNVSDLNDVLIHGDYLYSAMRDAGKINDCTDSFVQVAELPDTHTLNNCTFSIKYGQLLTGLFGISHYDEGLQGFAMSFDEAVKQAFQRFDACLVNMNHTICAVVRQGSWYAVIDPHSRHSDGTYAQYGKSVVTFYGSIESLLIHFKRLGASLNAKNRPFEVTGVEVNKCEQKSKCSFPFVSTTEHNEMKMNAGTDVCPQRSCIRGSFHQGHPRFNPNGGKQCAANSLIAIVMSKMKNVLQWTVSDLNDVLIHGDDLYSAMRDAGKIKDPIDQYIEVAELPDTHTLNNCTFSIKYGQLLTGLFGISGYDEGLQGFAMSFDEAVKQAFQRFDACLYSNKTIFA